MFLPVSSAFTVECQCVDGISTKWTILVAFCSSAGAGKEDSSSLHVGNQLDEWHIGILA